jgi:hypothetical protein
VAAAERIDVEEGQHLVTLKQLERRDIPYRELAMAYSRRKDVINTLDDLAENAGRHVFFLGW